MITKMTGCTSEKNTDSGTRSVWIRLRLVTTSPSWTSQPRGGRFMTGAGCESADTVAMAYASFRPRRRPFGAGSAGTSSAA